MNLRSALLSSLILGTLAPPALAASPNPYLTPQQLKQALTQRRAASRSFLFINVHVPNEGQIAGTDLNLRFDTIAQSRQLPSDKKTNIVLYCRSGRMSAEARQTLNKLGYTSVRELQGGFNAWKAAGYALK